VDDALAYDRTFALVSSFFSGITLLLASIGIYGLLAYSVSRRTNEMGIRLALGAGRQQLLWMVLRESLTLVVIGIVIGVPAALAAATLIKKTLYGVQSNDFGTLIAAILTLSLIAALATWIPARRASRVDPLAALRYE
jgi:ABC-type antimicrobial peptide transport system permease subunit